MQNLKKIIGSFKNQHILVVGDLVLDQYIKGSVSRISPEAPVPVVLQTESFYTPGGAANVATNLSTLGAKVTLAGKIGDDIEGDILKKELQRRNVEVGGIFTDPRIQTSCKTRIIAQHQQVVRLDREKVVDFGDDEFLRDQSWPFLQSTFNKYDAIIVSDYGKGFINASLIGRLVPLAKARGIPITVDPKVEHFQFYGEVTSITPNKNEAENALRVLPEDVKKKFGLQSNKIDGKNGIDKVGEAFLSYLKLESLLITLGEHGMVLFERGKKPFDIDTKAQEVFDVSGAGDTVISVFTLSLAAGASKPQAADLSNYAAGVVVGKMGAVAITKEELLNAIA